MLLSLTYFAPIDRFALVIASLGGGVFALLLGHLSTLGADGILAFLTRLGSTIHAGFCAATISGTHDRVTFESRTLFTGNLETYSFLN